MIAIPQHCIFKHTIVSIVPPENKPREEDPGGSLIKRTDSLIQVISLPVSDKSTYIAH